MRIKELEEGEEAHSDARVIMKLVIDKYERRYKVTPTQEAADIETGTALLLHHKTRHNLGGEVAFRLAGEDSTVSCFQALLIAVFGSKIVCYL